jgi:hypothetical protein
MDENGVKSNIHDIIKNDNQTLIVRLSEYNCQSCVRSLIENIKKTFSENDLKKVIFLLDYKDVVNINFFKRITKIEKTYKLNGQITPSDQLNVPYLFCLTKDGIVNKVFIPQEGPNEKLTKIYLNYIIEYLK